MSHRAVISITNGNVSAATWVSAAAEEPQAHGRAKACAECPLRVGGPWADGAQRALANVTSLQRAGLKRWGCHASPRPCAGMRRILGGAMIRQCLKIIRVGNLRLRCVRKPGHAGRCKHGWEWSGL